MNLSKSMFALIVCASLVTSQTQCGPISGAIGYFATKAIAYTLSVAVCVGIPQAAPLAATVGVAGIETGAATVASALTVCPFLP